MFEVGISAGTFNPIHLWHTLVADCARAQYGLNEVLFIPNGNPVHKTGVLDKEIRYEMVQAAIAKNPFFKASRVEIDRKGKSFTIDTLRALKAQYGDNVRLNLIVGIDNIDPQSSLPITCWRESEEVLRLCRLLISPREMEMAEAQKVAAMLPSNANFALIDCPTSTLSSTLVRERVKAGKSIRHLVEPEVFEIITKNRYYT
jgi:nicotinate-nucleotide adenylyltransferase